VSKKQGKPARWQQSSLFTVHKPRVTFAARELYISDLFKKNLAYAEKNYDRVLILSAKYGVLQLDEEIPYYNKTLNDMQKDEIEAWNVSVAEQLQTMLQPDDELFVLCGKNYYEGLLPKLPHKHTIIMEGLGIGRRLGWLKNNT
jgi:cytoplasmic iron level regulating protein YaaA (DUF328/UPF0246 family)